MEVVKKMSLPESAKDLDARSMPRVLSDNLFVESTSGLTEQEVRSAVSTSLSVEDDEEVFREEVELEMEEVTRRTCQEYTSKTTCPVKRKTRTVGKSRA
ncbi:unnamed protein product [Ectocarpus sp. CCAP 1310/34]|nr:unnamed protein product [Ectocarpus sp. CCAP 1310/34]